MNRVDVSAKALPYEKPNRGIRLSIMNVEFIGVITEKATQTLGLNYIHSTDHFNGGLR